MSQRYPEPDGYVTAPQPVGHQPAAYQPGQPMLPAPATGSLLVHMTNHLPAQTAAMHRPVLMVDGINHPVEWGSNRVVVPAGPHVVQAGLAGTDNMSEAVPLTVEPGLETVLYYAGSSGYGTRGTLGLTPQTAPRTAGCSAVGLLVAVGLALFVGLMLMLLFGLSFG